MAIAAGAFYAGRRYKGPIPFLHEGNEAAAQVSPSPVVAEATASRFEVARREIDNDPNGWLANQMKTDLAAQGVQNPLDSADPVFLYLYGRASMFTGNNEEAARAFEQAIVKSSSVLSPSNTTVKREATLALAAVALKSEKEKPRALTHFDEMLQKQSPAVSP